jgi:hypothetical protein
MIDFDRFWTEPGCAPGMTREETEAYLRQPAFGGTMAHLLPPGALDPGPGVTPEQVAAWEGAHGVRLPDVLRQALSRQDGGYVRDTQFRILPLAEIRCPDEEFWHFASYKEEEVADRRLVLLFAWNDEFSGSYYLNYNAQGPDGEPSVLVHHHDPGDLDRCAKSVSKFLTRMLDTADTPQVDWSETASLEILARETIDLSRLDAAGAAFEQVLGRQGGALVLFTRERTSEGERLTRTTLPEPLENDGAFAGSWRPHRSGPVRTYALQLQPRETDGMVAIESKQTKDGRWKNATSRGVPIYVMFESTDRDRIEALRQVLFSDDVANDRTREEREKGRQKVREYLAQLPTDPATAMELLRQKLRETLERARHEISGLPGDSETCRPPGEGPQPGTAGDDSRP